MFSDDQAGSRDHDPGDESGLAGEHKRFGEDSGHVSPPVVTLPRPVWVTRVRHSSTVAKRWRTTALIMYERLAAMPNPLGESGRRGDGGRSTSPRCLTPRHFSTRHQC